MISDHISDDIPPQLNFKYGYPHSNVLLQYHLKLESCKPLKAATHPRKCDVINDITLFATVYTIRCRVTKSSALECYNICLSFFFKYCHFFSFV